MAIKDFPPPPTYAEPTLIDPQTKQASFNPIWLKWFLDVAQGLGSLGLNSAGQIPHDVLGGLQGGQAPNQFYHLTVAQFLALWSNPMTTDGDIIIMSGGGPVRLPRGVDGQVLTLVAGVPAWV